MANKTPSLHISAAQKLFLSQFSAFNERVDDILQSTFAKPKLLEE